MPKAQQALGLVYLKKPAVNYDDDDDDPWLIHHMTRSNIYVLILRHLFMYSNVLLTKATEYYTCLLYTSRCV